MFQKPHLCLAGQRKSLPAAGLAIFGCLVEAIILHFAAASLRRRRSGTAGVMHLVFYARY
jgi:hypothetical protein